MVEFIASVQAQKRWKGVPADRVLARSSVAFMAAKRRRRVLIVDSPVQTPF